MAVPALAAKTDVVVLRNGDRVTGEVKQLERGRLEFSTDDMGTIQIEWEDVRSVTALASFDIDDVYGHRYLGSLQPGEEPGELLISSPIGPVTLPLYDILRMRRLGATFWERLDGSLDFGASYTSASDLFKLDLSAELGTERPGYELLARANSTLSFQEGIEDTRRSSLILGYTHRYPDRWVALVRGQLEQNRELGFDLRTTLAGGAGRYLVRDPSNRFLATLGLATNHEDPVEGEGRTNLEAMAGMTFDRYSHDFPNIDVSFLVVGFASLNEGGRYRVELEASIRRELLSDFYATLRGYESYDSSPPTEGAETDDYGLTFALGWSF